MKKIILLFAALTTIATVSAEVSTPELDFNAGTSETYEVGDIITVNGQRGVVFVVSPDGMHGMVLSLDCCYEVTWYEATEWAGSYPGWRLPSFKEFGRLREVLEEVNTALIINTGKFIGDDIYWTSEFPDSSYEWTNACRVGTHSGIGTSAYNHFAARAVSAF